MTSLTQQLEALWESSDSPPDVFEFLQQHNGAAGDDVVGVLLTDQHHRWKTEAPIKVEDYLERLPALASDLNVKLQLAVGEFQARQAADTSPNFDEFTSRFSDISDQLRSKLSELALAGNEQEERITTTQTFISDQTIGHGQRGRYRLERVLGEGAFGRVYLAYDEELQRQVAIKVPTAERFQQPEDADQYLAEARTVASLNHPNIVPVYDTGRTDDGSIYVVSKFIEGCTLDDRIKQDRPSHDESAKLIATVAQALHHAHDRRLIHRDVKPGNILLEGFDATPYVADFGLAIREEDYLKDRKLAGTPAYMSPEQARGEGHRLDGRSDIFSLGVVLYELLTGKKPFRGSTANELLHQVVSVDPRPPRELDESIPAELERICLKSLSKRASDRYATAVELADDLLHWNQSRQQETKELQIVPKGLRSFDAEDAEFFLDLLPGPRNRSGLPESIRFWKIRIEEVDPDRTFSVGLIYGPSGCGKSSLVKAGLLPRLSKDVTAIYVEATPDETEICILRGLRKSLPELPQDLGLVETFSLLRRAEGTKVIVVLDQFEQWLHAHRAEQETELVAALRQCDGRSLQAVVMVRDDFGMAAARFMDVIDIPIVQGRNFATVDLFDVDHAEKVLVKFGQAFGKLPAHTGKLSEGEQSFVRSVASGLAQDGKVVSVRLALFAEMVKGKPWVPATLEEVGGTEGIGVNFLEETFSSRTANPKHRLHQQAAREVLKALLPEVGSDIKGHMWSHSELLEASGYQNRHGEFNDLLRILDGELRLITPTDPEGFQTESGSDPGSKFYQLTHDYLVPSLRDWLTRKQKETRKGRTELLLAERAALWNARPENRHLPSLLEWASIRTLTEKNKWTEPYRKMMGKAGRVHGLRSSLVVAGLVAVVFAGVTIRNAVERGRQELLAEQKDEQRKVQAAEIVQGLLRGDTAQVRTIIGNLAPYRQYAKDDLKKAFEESLDDSNAKLHAALAMLPDDKSVLPFLKDRLLTVTPMQFECVRNLLNEDKGELVASYWEKAKTNETPAVRFQAACALASFDPSNEHWQDKDFRFFIAGHLVGVQPSELLPWTNALRPVKEHLVDPLSTIYRSPESGEQVRSFATVTLADYWSDNPDGLFDLLADANEKQFGTIFNSLNLHREQAVALGKWEVGKTPTENASEADRESLAMRQANAAVMLLKMDAPDQVWPLLKHSPDPRVRSYIIHWLSQRGGDPKTIIARYELETDVSIKRALLLCLGEFALRDSDKQPFVKALLDDYRSDPDAGLHAAAEWLLRQWSVPLPDLPVGEPELSKEQQVRIAQLETDLEDVRQQIVLSEENLVIRQRAWERDLVSNVDRPPPVPMDELIVHLPLDESKERQIVNAVRPSDIGQFSSSSGPDWISGVFGTGIELNGIDQYLILGEVFEPKRGCALSFSCWFHSEMNKEAGTLISKWQYAENAARGFFVEVRPRKGSFAIFLEHLDWDNALILESESGLIKDQWHHLCVTYDGTSQPSGLSLYLDGNLQTMTVVRDSLTGTIQNTAPLRLGSRTDPKTLFAGGVDDARIYARTLSEQDIENLFTAGVKSLVHGTPDNRTSQQERTLRSTYRPLDEPLNQLDVKLAEAETAIQKARWDGVRRWYTNGQGQTFVILDAGEFRMGSPETEAGRTIETLHRRNIGRRIAVATKEVTRGQWRRFYDATKVWPADQDQVRPYTRSDDSPMVAMTWYEAAHYCNWLSGQEGIPEEQWCYEKNKEDKYGPGMRAKENLLELTGYRLPTEAEWEYACRAGASSVRYYGVTEALLPRYAWYQTNGENHTHPVASLKPNDYGLFDMHGNAYEWCYDTYVSYPTPKEEEVVKDAPAVASIEDAVRRVLRGGEFSDQASNVRSAHRTIAQPDGRGNSVSFRPARTCHLPP